VGLSVVGCLSSAECHSFEELFALPGAEIYLFNISSSMCDRSFSVGCRVIASEEPAMSGCLSGSMLYPH